LGLATSSFASHSSILLIGGSLCRRFRVGNLALFFEWQESFFRFLVWWCCPRAGFFSVNPQYEENLSKPDPDLTFDPTVVGSWGRVDDACLWILTITANGQTYEFTLGPSPQCKNDAETTRYEGHLVKLGTHLVLDVSPRHEEVCFSCMPLQSLLLVEADKDSFKLTPIDDEWLKKSIEQKREALSVLPGDSDVLTSSTSDLKRSSASMPTTRTPLSQIPT
jgi:hypothetical protein